MSPAKGMIYISPLHVRQYIGYIIRTSGATKSTGQKKGEQQEGGKRPQTGHNPASCAIGQR